jgi:hypothetical protein
MVDNVEDHLVDVGQVLPGPALTRVQQGRAVATPLSFRINRKWTDSRLTRSRSPLNKRSSNQHALIPKAEEGSVVALGLTPPHISRRTPFLLVPIYFLEGNTTVTQFDRIRGINKVEDGGNVRG